MKQANFKIFCIGLNKTGTTSLASALTILGFPCRHSINHNISVCNGMVTLPQFHNFSAFADGGLYRYFMELDKTFPDSRFIFTQRDVDGWIISRAKHVLKNRKDPRYKGTLLEIDTVKWQKWHDEHAKDVTAYFAGRQNCLTMNICGGDGWKKLCPFLDVPVPAKPFPRLNVNSKM